MASGRRSGLPTMGSAVVGSVVLMGAMSSCVVMDEDAPKEASPPQSETVTWTPEAQDSGNGIDLPTVTVEWGAAVLRVEISDNGNWTLGMAETGGACGGSVACWTGEDCHTGFTTTDGDLLGPYCHPMTGGVVELEYGGDWQDLQAGTTVFHEAYAGTVTYLLRPADDDLPCLVFGNVSEHFADLGCTMLTN